MDTPPTSRDIDASEAAETLRELAELWGGGFSVEPDAIVMRGRGRGPRPPQEASLLRKMVIFEARREGHSRRAIADALGIDEKTVLRHENEAKAWMIEEVQKFDFSVVDVEGRVWEYLLEMEKRPEPTVQFFDQLRRAIDGKRAGPRQMRRRAHDRAAGAVKASR